MKARTINMSSAQVSHAEEFLISSGYLSSLDENCIITPGFCDVHVHLREPGFVYKETVATGTRAAAHGGYTAVCSMPNLSPAPDSLDNLEPQLAAIHRDAVIPVFPYGTVTVGEDGTELSDMEALAPYVCAFSDDGRGVQSKEMMRRAMAEAKRLGKIIAAHCEDNSLLGGGYIHDGAYAKAHSHRGIPSESEYAQIARDLELAAEIGCAYHVCHISARKSVELIRQAKRDGLDVTCETAPHYLVLDDSDLREDGSFKMNPPLRDRADKEALLEGIADGTVDMIATDHAPHSAEEKARGLKDSVMGVVGLESAFPVLYTELVLGGIISLEKLCCLMSTSPRARFGITSDPGFTVFSLGDSDTVDPASFFSMGRSTPFAGREVKARCILTAVGGDIVYCDKKYKGKI